MGPRDHRDDVDPDDTGPMNDSPDRTHPAPNAIPGKKRGIDFPGRFACGAVPRCVGPRLIGGECKTGQTLLGAPAPILASVARNRFARNGHVMLERLDLHRDPLAMDYGRCAARARFNAFMARNFSYGSLAEFTACNASRTAVGYAASDVAVCPVPLRLIQ